MRYYFPKTFLRLFCLWAKIHPVERQYEGSRRGIWTLGSGDMAGHERRYAAQDVTDGSRC